jgi:predicted nuclease of restriction endonuclease-like (RecB) superfamily
MALNLGKAFGEFMGQLGSGWKKHEAKHITQFLLELGAGFAFVQRQIHTEVGGDDFFIALRNTP